jgi:phosphatidylglycerophosphatase A
VSARASTPEPAAPSAAAAAPARKPRFALFCATVCGLGYIPVAPGTFGSLVGLALYDLFARHFVIEEIHSNGAGSFLAIGRISHPFVPCIIAVVIALGGVWASSRAAEYSGKKDPQFVVIDEVSGQFLGYTLALSVVSWKYLLLGLILFRVFDIWKPFPARQAESLPGGWGIMADDWVAAIYAAIGLWIARGFGL